MESADQTKIEKQGTFDSLDTFKIDKSHNLFDNVYSNLGQALHKIHLLL